MIPPLRLTCQYCASRRGAETVDAFTASEDSNVGTPQVLCSRDR